MGENLWGCVVVFLYFLQGTLPSKKNKKMSQIPVQLDLRGMLAVLEEKKHAEKLHQSFKPLVLSGMLLILFL